MLNELFVAFGILGICLIIHIIGMVFAGDQLLAGANRSNNGQVLPN